MVDLSIGTAGLAAVLGYAVVFFGIVLLMAVIYIMGSIMKKNASAAAAAAPAVSDKTEIKEEVTDLGSIHAPEGMDPKKVAAVAAVIAAMEGDI